MERTPAAFGQSTVTITATVDYSVRDPVLTILLAVQAGKIGGVTALYAIRALVKAGWPEVGA